MTEKITKHKQYGFVYGVRTKTPACRVAWVHLVEPKESTFPVDEGKEAPAPRYEVTLLLPKNEVTEKWKADLQPQIDEMVTLFNKDRKGAKIAIDDYLKDGDDMDLEKYPFYAGHYFVVPKNKERPTIFDAELNPASPESVVGGMPVIGIIRPLCTAHGISFQLRTIQLLEDDGVRFAGSVTSDKDLLTAIEGDKEEAEQAAPEVAPAVAAKATKGKAKGTMNLDSLA